MRGWPLVATLALLLAAIPVLAQRGGGHGGGGHGGFGGHMGGGSHFGGMSFGSRGFGGSHSPRSFSRQAFSRQSFAGRSSYLGRGIAGNRFRGSRSRLSIRTRGRGYPWGYAGFYDPYWWWDSGSSYDQDQADQIAEANQMNEESLQEQQMRDQADQDLDARSAPPQRQSADAQPAPIMPPTVLVFRDQHKEEVQNYAIVGSTLWTFSAQRTQKIPLSDLDLAATQKANDDRGVDFRVPDASVGQ